VNLDPFFARQILGPRLGSFLKRFPDLQVELLTSDQLGDMVADGFDLAIRFGHPKSSSLVARKLLDCRVLTIAAPAYLKRHGRPLSPNDLKETGHVCIQFRDPLTARPFPWEFIRGRKRVVIDTGGQLILNDAGTLYATCLAGYGIAQVFDMGIGPLLSSGQLVDIFPDWADETFPLYAYYPSRKHPSAKTKAFLEFVQTLL
jgi:DNA-binding transcriptional LysR family regulator